MTDETKPNTPLDPHFHHEKADTVERIINDPSAGQRPVTIEDAVAAMNKEQERMARATGQESLLKPGGITSTRPLKPNNSDTIGLCVIVFAVLIALVLVPLLNAMIVGDGTQRVSISLTDFQVSTVTCFFGGVFATILVFIGMAHLKAPDYD